MKWFCLAPAILMLHPVTAQSTLKVDVKVVAVTAVVRDKHGVLLHDLTRDDFVLKEDGKTQEIRYFTQDDDLPLQLGLLVDTSGSEHDYTPPISEPMTYHRIELRAKQKGVVVQARTGYLTLPH